METGILLFHFQLMDMKKNLVLSTLVAGTFLLQACEAENLPPVVDAGPNQYVASPANSTELKGVATDTDGAIVRYQWTKVLGPATYTLTSPNAAVTRVEGLEAGWYEFQLQVTDDDGLWATDNVIVSVGEVDPCFGCWDY